MRQARLGVTLAAGIWAATGVQAPAETVLFFDVHELPADCVGVMTCIQRGEPFMSAIMRMPEVQALDLAGALNRRAEVRDLSHYAALGLCQRRLEPILQQEPIAARVTPLRDHPGVFFDSTRLDNDAATVEFSGLVRDALSDLGLRFLTEDEMMATPGRPVLKMSFSPRRESGNCIVPFRVSMSIQEEMTLVRDVAIKVKSNVWAASQGEDLSNTNYNPLNAVHKVVEKFIKDWNEAHKVQN